MVRVHVVAGLRQAALWVALALLAGLPLALLADQALDGGYRRSYGLVLMVLAALLAFSGGDTGISRAATLDARAFLGWGPEREDRVTRGALTPVGTMLFVSVPLFVVGGLLVS